MIDTEHLSSVHDVAARAAALTVRALTAAIADRGHAVWVLAGGSSPMAAYEIIRDTYAESLDWSRVSVFIGDERMVPFDDSDSNWGAIQKILFASGPTAQILQIPPDVTLAKDVTAANYAQFLQEDAPIIDVLWLGVGEDGHTLSLFPGHPEIHEAEQLVVAVHDSPKPPATRISFTLNAVKRAATTLIFATGAGKKDALARALNGEPLPIAIVADAISDAGGNVTFLFDEAATT